MASWNPSQESLRDLALAIAEELMRQAAPDTIRLRSGLLVTINEHSFDCLAIARATVAEFSK